MSMYYVKDGEPFIPEAINPDLAKLAKAIVKTCHLTFKMQMKTTALNNALKTGDKEQMKSVMLKCIEKNKSSYKSDMSLTGVTIDEVPDDFFADKDEEFYKKQLAVLLDFAAINTVVDAKAMPIMSAACVKTLGVHINQIYFFTNQTEILASSDEEETDAE